MGKRIGILLLLASCLQSFGSATLLHRELFTSVSNNVGSLSSTNADQFDSFTGTMQLVGVGAHATNTASGWSGLARDQVTSYGTWASLTTGYICGWYCFNQFAQTPADSSHSSGLFVLNSYDKLTVDSAGSLWMLRQSTTSPIVTNALPLYRWVFIALAWLQHGDNTADFKIYLASLGGSLTNVFSSTGTPEADLISITAGNNPSSWGGNFWVGRITGLSLYQITSFSDVAIPSDIALPPATRSTWYVSSSGGDDTLYDGLSTNTPWASSHKLVTSLVDGTIIGNPQAPWAYVSDGSPVATNINPDVWVAAVTNATIRANGDTVLIDTSTGPLEWTDELIITPAAQGVEITSAHSSRAVLHVLKTVPKSFTQYDGVNFPLIWKTADLDGKSCLWEDRKWMNNPIGANITAVRTNLNTTPGSFYNDGAFIYFSTFDGSNPNANAFIYERSRLRTNNGTAGANPPILLAGPTYHVHNLDFGGVTMRDPTTGDSGALYCVQATDGVYGAIGDCNIYYGCNHCYGATDGPTNLVRLVYRSSINQGPPWAPNVSGFNPVVEFSANASGSRMAYFVDVNAITNSIPGSADGISELYTNAITGFFSHASATWAYSLLRLDRCVGSIAMGIATNSIISGCIANRLSLYSQNSVVSNTVVYNQITGPPTSSAVLVNCIIAPTPVTPVTEENWISGPWTFSNCTFDLRQASPATSGYLKSDTTLSLQITNINNVIIGANSFIRIKPADTVVSDRNVVLMTQATFATYNSDAKTFAQWQALGFDGNSATNLANVLDSRLRPYAKTPCWTTGAELGPATDFTGKLFQSRRTAGAYEYVTPQPTLLMFGQ